MVPVDDSRADNGSDEASSGEKAAEGKLGSGSGSLPDKQGDGIRKNQQATEEKGEDGRPEPEKRRNHGHQLDISET